MSDDSRAATQKRTHCLNADRTMITRRRKEWTGEERGLLDRSCKVMEGSGPTELSFTGRKAVAETVTSRLCSGESAVLYRRSS
ncbi:hypothetical protein EVAR_54965_1 [Eumeta japonica]|uniref:Uncharacterized protein n=1 Tax=Eumeta variegata TaxID=151549 RepID=A0A4C1YJH1_EUMVA|nr:hypothetical protein EVAR_54965_1 [Eumeta japonica]